MKLRNAKQCDWNCRLNEHWHHAWPKIWDILRSCKKSKKMFCYFCQIIVSVSHKNTVLFWGSMFVVLPQCKISGQESICHQFLSIHTEATVSICLKNVLRNRTLTQIIVTTIWKTDQLSNGRANQWLYQNLDVSGIQGSGIRIPTAFLFVDSSLQN